MEKQTICQGVNLNVIETNKYKDISIFIYFFAQEDIKGKIIKELLTYIIGNKTKKYNSKSSLRNIKDNLYGASVNSGALNFGNSEVFQIYCKILNERFLNEQILDKFFDLIKEIINNSIIDDDTVNEAKNHLIDKMLRRTDNVNHYSNSQSLNIYGENTYLYNSLIFDINDINQVNTQDVINSYNKILKENNIDIYVVGEVNSKCIYSYLNEIFNLKRVPTKFQIEPIKKRKFLAKYEEEKNITQTTLTMLYKTNVYIDDFKQTVLKVINCYLGQGPASLLFQEVREKNNLCYSIFSYLHVTEDLLVVKTAINYKNYNKTIKIIDEQIDKLKSGNFDMKDVKSCLNLYINYLNGVEDDLSLYIKHKYTSSLLNVDKEIDDIINDMQKVTKQDIIEVFSSVEFLFSHLLKGKNENE